MTMYCVLHVPAWCRLSAAVVHIYKYFVGWKWKLGDWDCSFLNSIFRVQRLSLSKRGKDEARGAINMFLIFVRTD